MVNHLLVTLLEPFLIGGSVIAGVKWASLYLNPGLAAVIGGVPTGLISSMFIAQDQRTDYVHNYIFVTAILLVAVLLYYYLLIKTKLDKTYAFVIALVFWILAQLINQYRLGNLHGL